MMLQVAAVVALALAAVADAMLVSSKRPGSGLGQVEDRTGPLQMVLSIFRLAWQTQAQVLCSTRNF